MRHTIALAVLLLSSQSAQGSLADFRNFIFKKSIVTATPSVDMSCTGAIARVNAATIDYKAFISKSTYF